MPMLYRANSNGRTTCLAHGPIECRHPPADLPMMHRSTAASPCVTKNYHPE